MPRLFIGIPVPDTYHEKLATLIGTLSTRLQSRIAWTRPANTHITLKFLGDVAAQGVDDIRRVLSAIEFPAFHMRVGGCGCFPNEKDPRVVWAGVMKGTRRCTELAAIIEAVMESLGFSRETRPFNCHLTLGRVKRLVGADDLERRLREASGIWPGFKVDRFVLWESELHPDGPVYTPVDIFMLQDEVE